MNAQGGDRQIVGGTQPRAQSWNPAGDRIAYESYLGDIRIIQADGSSEVDLPNSMSGFNPRFSPDGTQLVYSTLFGGELHIINADGSNDHAIPNVPGGWIDGVDWRW